ncbi:DUF6541 family protein [Haloarchaeobius amylolyticus]|uniref:DUF6541 family protein n=1 Tax=Haloarchaeobius amylolyticus TaxID=1198296 RepID=A0ABD6BH04_9EURY
MSPHYAADDDPFRKLALAIAFLAVSVSTLSAHANPATGYELSIYTMTPRVVWVGLLIALSVSLAVVFVPFSETSRDRSSRSLAVVLGGLVFAVFIGMPIIRGYRFYGHHDALTHLGWARGIREGTFLPFDLFYPGIHTVTVFISSTIGISLSRSMLFVAFLAVLLFCLFIPLCVLTIVPDDRAAAIAAFSAFLLLPITTISMYLSAHAMSQAVLFSPVLLFLLTKYLGTDQCGSILSAVGVALALSSVAAVLYHPQLAAHLIIALLGICAVQYFARRTVSSSRVTEQTSVYGQTLFLIAVFLVWSSNYGFFAGTMEYFLGSVVEFLFREGGAVGDTVGSQSASLAAIGGSLTEIFLKLFLPQLVFSLLAGGLALSAVLSGKSQWLKQMPIETAYFAVALFALGPVFLAYFFAAGSKMYFRVFGLMMVFVTVLGSIAIYRIVTRSGPSQSRSGRSMLTVGFALLLVLSLVAVFPSPYTYNASPHVSEQHFNGYQSAFDSQDEAITFVGLRDGPNRIHDAIHGNEERMRLYQGLSDEAIENGVQSQSDDGRYLALTQADYEREVDAYRELRYSEQELNAIGTQPGVSRIQSNGEFDLYYVDAGTADS